MKKYYSFWQNGNEANIYIYGDITSWEWNESDTSSYTLSKELEGIDADTINVYINSYGGEVGEGLAIYNMLKRQKAKVITYCDGFACSIASVIFMAGDERIVTNASLIYIHNAWTYAAGNADELRKVADELDVISRPAINVYLDAVNISEEQLKEMLHSETWLLPEESLEMGFATSMVTETVKTASQSVKSSLFDIVLKHKEKKPQPAPTTKPDESQEPKPQENKIQKLVAALFR